MRTEKHQKKGKSFPVDLKNQALNYLGMYLLQIKSKTKIANYNSDIYRYTLGLKRDDELSQISHTLF
jgi:hypothetical protein